MIRSRLRASLLLLSLPLLAASIPACAQSPSEIGGQKIVTLSRAVSSSAKPEFTKVVLLPGRGMEILSVTANYPGKGPVEVIWSPDLATSAKTLDQDDDAFGNLGYRLGAAMLVPYPNRIRGTLSADQKTLTTSWQGHTLTLPANNIGKLPTAERHAMHGLILKAKTDDLKVKEVPGGQQAVGIIHAGDFGGHWPSKTDLLVTVTLTGDAVDVAIAARNVGKEAEPMAIAWHPYFNIPSGDRTQARLYVPGQTTAEIDNYDNVFPTGKILPVKGTRYDLSQKGGKALGQEYFDDNWNTLERKDGVVTVDLTDPAFGYGVHIEGLSPEISAIQVYAPPTKAFAAIEHQYNYADPFGKEWGKTNTGMVTLKPGESTNWHVRLRVFVP